MEKDNNTLTYDQALSKAEAIIKELEQSQALSMDVYQLKAAEAARYIAICRQQIGKMEEQLSLTRPRSEQAHDDRN